jgi:hypothetical protein
MSIDSVSWNIDVTNKLNTSFLKSQEKEGGSNLTALTLSAAKSNNDNTDTLTISSDSQSSNTDKSKKLEIYTGIPNNNKDKTNNTGNIAGSTTTTDSTKNKDKTNNGKNSNKSGKTEETSSGKKISKEEKQLIDNLKKIDKEVRTHEAAHEAAGGSLVRGESFSYTTGPDNQQYAVGGEVQIDMSTVPNDPRATVSKMQTVIRAALAPSDPSGQDRSVAATAASIENEAISQELQSTASSISGTSGVSSTSSTPTTNEASNSNSTSNTGGTTNSTSTSNTDSTSQKNTSTSSSNLSVYSNSYNQQNSQIGQNIDFIITKSVNGSLTKNMINSIGNSYI